MKGYTVIWTTYVETTDDHVAAAREVAESYFQPRISAGEPDTACVFIVTDSGGKSQQVDLAEHQILI
ncbi:hypothetical protein [Pseudomonas sp. DC3000-4b1]|uniref:hypothetical protein n=1 Tax=unclassified Pseudomonas TaxID=196821 RepID=UPI003CEF87A4